MDSSAVGEREAQHVAMRRVKLREVKANPTTFATWTPAEIRRYVLYFKLPEREQRKVDEQWERQGAELRRREQEREQRAMLERAFHARARRAGFELVRTEGQLTWERIPSMRAPVAPRRADVRRSPRRQRSGTQRSARSPGRQDEPPLPPAELTRLQAALHLYLASMELAEDLDERELDAFISIGSIRFARVASRLRWWEAA